ncbi:mechanosensitive ion channel family protein [Parabacteroides sp. 52]|uniref:mechanosensitive ion channel family protein n=1 Tax=unclassified Parabacteroides TaxID=2649774 RepID=UPI0013D88276|nr:MULTISPECIES: mechanosensitive ion channel domain-containing protein [unclassified Parabacteroides]MDH6534500.1 miniconductance mechanosensitive channel [Parabacteroides sp. PM5-20]NDV55050.1 mechanosensitive ion channel family protein [Parabacteroides sp. 52]
MNNMQEWITETLLEWGIIESTVGYWDNIIILLLILLLAFVVDYVCNHIIIGIFKRIAVRTKTDWDDLILDRKIIHKIINVIPAILIYILLPIAFAPWDSPIILLLLQKVCKIYIIAVSLRFINASLNLVNELYNRRAAVTGKSIKGFIQVIQLLLLFIGIILIISILISESPAKLFAGLGASAAVLMLVFKDSILGFVAGIQLSANDMLRPGDWITMNKYGADGTVIDVTLNAIKVRNFDNTIVTIPPYSLVSDSFQNWRGMSDSPGRRIKRSINIDMNSVRFCTPEMLGKYRKIDLLTEYIDQKEAELRQYNEKNQIDNSIQVNGRRQTNLGVFRAYLERYLRNHPDVSKELTCMVRHLQPTEKGIPIELYFFSAEKRWIFYESIQADIFDHILAIIPEFGLEAFQNISGADIRALNRQTTA